jgi:cytochrome P450
MMPEYVISPDVPRYPVDIYSDAALLDPLPHYRALHELGPVVWLDAHQMYVVARYAEARAVLADDSGYCSGQGVAMNDLVNTAGRGTTLMSDGDLHTHLRKVVAHGLTPRALASMRDQVQAQADALVERLVAGESFDAVTDLAQALPLTVVPDLLGLPTDCRPRLLEWASAGFNVLGPMNERAVQCLATFEELLRFAERTAREHGFTPLSLGADMCAAVQRGDLDPSQLSGLIIDYATPSLDTTISAIGSAVWLFATNPDQWRLLRAEPDRIPNAFNEVVRLESPLRSFTRVANDGAVIGGHRLPAGARVIVHYAAANRDERRWPQPDRFDITRPAGGQLGYGYGVHGCAGQGLARLEGEAVLRALVSRVEAFDLGTPVRGLNNLINSFASLPVALIPARAGSPGRPLSAEAGDQLGRGGAQDVGSVGLVEFGAVEEALAGADGEVAP